MRGYRGSDGKQITIDDHAVFIEQALRKELLGFNHISKLFFNKPTGLIGGSISILSSKTSKKYEIIFSKSKLDEFEELYNTLRQKISESINLNPNLFIFTTISNTKVLIDGDFIRITRYGAFDMLKYGLDGEKSINMNNITAVQLRRPVTGSGYIQFSLPGSNESKQGIFAALKDENTIMFTAPELDKAEKIKEHIEQILSSKGNNTTAPTDSSAEIRKYKQLLDEGIITQEEFNAKKRQLLGL